MLLSRPMAILLVVLLVVSAVPCVLLLILEGLTVLGALFTALILFLCGRVLWMIYKDQMS